MTKHYIKKSPLGYFHVCTEIDGKVTYRKRFATYDMARCQFLFNKATQETIFDLRAIGTPIAGFTYVTLPLAYYTTRTTAIPVF